MLWYKTWLETRLRFLIGLTLLVCCAAVIVMAHPKMVRDVLPLATSVDPEGAVGAEIRESVALLRTYRGYVWSQWFDALGAQFWTVFAVLLGTGGLLIQASLRGGALYTLSMPVSRTRLLVVRAATGLAELFLMAVVPALMFPLLSPLVGQTYGVGEALVYGTCLFVAGSVFFSVAFLMSTMFRDVGRPLLIGFCVVFVTGLFGQAFPDALPSKLLVMTAEDYFRGDGVPWLGLLSHVGVSAALLYGALRNIARQDF